MGFTTESDQTGFKKKQMNIKLGQANKRRYYIAYETL